MSHAKSLRVIGATLEAAQVTSFKLEKHAAPYRLWIAKRLFCFGPADISRLDARAQKKPFYPGFNIAVSAAACGDPTQNLPQ